MDARTLVPDRTIVVDGLEVCVYDGLLDDPKPYVGALSRAAFTHTEVARPDTASYRHWATEISVEALIGQPIFDLTWRAVRDRPSRRADYRPYRAYTNFASFGDMLFTHTDCLPGRHELTALWYLCEEWDVEWGGETMFYDSSDEVALAVRPRPGRLVVFDGAIKHAGRPPSRVCTVPRYTMAIKFEPIGVTGR